MKTAKLKLANLPTPVKKSAFLSKEFGINLYIKRDDYTGIEISGNKIRKLEYVFKKVLDSGCNGVITTGGIQSNHCRATVAAATSLGLKSIVLLKVSEEPKIEGNFFLDNLFGAQIRYCTPDEYRTSRNQIMQSIAAEKTKEGDNYFVIPEGASFGIGSMGYFEAMEEIVQQEKELGIKFDTIVVATGSGGTYSGLYLANKYHNLNKRIIGFAVCDDSEYFVNQIDEINKEALEFLDKEVRISREDIEIDDKYKGIGYAISRPEELEFIKLVASREALLLDPVYTGKAMYGLYNEAKAGNLKAAGNVLFIHTGGVFGLFPKQDQFVF
jgi:D-cysteine desulfhydrase